MYDELRKACEDPSVSDKVVASIYMTMVPETTIEQHGEMITIVRKHKPGAYDLLGAEYAYVMLKFKVEDPQITDAQIAIFCESLCKQYPDNKNDYEQLVQSVRPSARKPIKEVLAKSISNEDFREICESDNYADEKIGTLFYGLASSDISRVKPLLSILKGSEKRTAVFNEISAIAQIAELLE